MRVKDKGRGHWVNGVENRIRTTTQPTTLQEKNNHTRWRGRKEKKWSWGEREESVKDTGWMGLRKRRTVKNRNRRKRRMAENAREDKKRDKNE